MSGARDTLYRLLETWCPCTDYRNDRLDEAALQIDAAAFGAIRRAAECARKADAWDVYHGHLIRQAIRAAITSSSKRTPQTHRNAHPTTGARDE